MAIESFKGAMMDIPYPKDVELNFQAFIKGVAAMIKS